MQNCDQLGEMTDNSGREVWIYFTSPHPRDMKRDVMKPRKETFLPADPPAGSVGRRQGFNKDDRKHMDRYREVVGWIRELVPQATLLPTL